MKHWMQYIIVTEVILIAMQPADNFPSKYLCVKGGRYLEVSLQMRESMGVTMD